MRTIKPLSTILNTIIAILAIALAGGSTWFYLQLKNLTDLQNQDRNLLDYNVHWPVLLPWIHICISIAVICVSCCGIFGVCKKNKCVLFTYVTMLAVATVATFAAGFIGLTDAETKEETEKIVSDSVTDAFEMIGLREDVKIAFHDIEKAFRCCGIDGSVSYTNANDPPESCCVIEELGPKGDCKSSAIRRHGCKEVLVNYVHMYIGLLSIGSLFLCVVCSTTLIVAVVTIVWMFKKPTRLRSLPEAEPLKVP